MLLTLLAHQWKANSRSPVFQKSLVLNIILALLILYFGAIFLFLGFNLDTILAKAYPKQSPIDIFNGALLFYFLIDLFFRFVMQELPVLAVQPYLHLPIPKQKLIHFVLLKSVPGIFNLLFLLIFVPFMLSAIIPEYGTGTALAWLFAAIALTLFNNFLLIYFKRQLSNKPMLTLLFGVGVAGLMLLDYAGAFSLYAVSRVVFGALLLQPWLVAVPVLLLAGVYVLNYNFLKAHTYPEELRVRENKQVEGKGIVFLNRFGELGKLIELELKLIWRHKRSKSVVTMSVIFLFYGFIFYGKDTYMDGFAMLIFVGIAMTGMPVFNYGQFVPGWQSAHFDALLTRRISPYQFYAAKFWIFVPTVVLVYILTLPYGVFGYKIILINTAAMLFNIGVNLFVVFYFSVYNKSRLDLSKSSAFNWQGVGASKFLMTLPLLVLPSLIYAPFGFMGVPYIGIATIGLLGLVGITFHKPLLQWTANRFVKHKYKLAAGFRQA
ncbi:hypothetical protein DXT99_00670 [Pontibacter diazotrophicus]|uniref:Uncharacterized protein n=1 Tax=Pontibacter diazotrophicus TaxID=1400979 RepID=A0A3D8LIL0_9BACT|nr:DUF5687 family protein [Pontibacter diazotrophicus]RDV17064.1 hypothetical protein DXT99_00670 [Pontibacter diazotrophicus]